MFAIKKEKIILLGVNILAIPLFWLSNLINPNPGQTSGNGNPAILFMGILFLLFCYSVYLWMRTFHYHNIKPITLTISTFVMTLHLLIAFAYQRSSFIKYREVLADAYKENFGFVDWEYIEQITSFMSIHVNNQYFNLNTYIMFLTLSALIALIIDGLRKKIFNNPL